MISHQSTSFWLTSKGLAALGLIAAVTYFLLVEHRQHVIQFLPYLILLLCPFMHMFMHRGHGAHNREGKPGRDRSDDYHRGFEVGRRDLQQNDNQGGGDAR